MTTLLESPRSKTRNRSKVFRVAFIPTQVSGVAYYRMCQFAWKMRKWPRVETVAFPYSSKHTKENPWQNDILHYPEIRNKFESIIDKADIVVWQVLAFPHSLEFFMDMKTKFQKPFLTEMDDYIDDIPAGNEAFQAFQPSSSFYKVARQQIRMSDGLVVSTPYLAKLYEGRSPAIYVVPNSIDLNEWKGLDHSRHERIRIGWIGGGTHAKDLELIKEPLDAILKKYPQAWFYCIHGVPGFVKEWAKEGRHVYYTYKWGYINLYPRFMSSFKFDIGAAPLEDNNFNRAKSNLRWLEYSALKIPSVCSPLPDFSRAIESGKNGFIAQTPEDWKDTLSTLIENSVSRETMGQEAYGKIRADFNAQKTARDYLRLLRSIA